jgi:hypothetical protein
MTQEFGIEMQIRIQKMDSFMTLPLWEVIPVRGSFPLVCYKTPHAWHKSYNQYTNTSTQTILQPYLTTVGQVAQSV